MSVRKRNEMTLLYNLKGILRYERFRWTTKVFLSVGVVLGSILRRTPGDLKHEIHWRLWNLADHSRYADYWWAILHLSMPWAYKPRTFVEMELIDSDEYPTYPSVHWDYYHLEVTNG